MRSYWSFIGNGKYDIGCTGRTVCLLDKRGTEVAKFNDLQYAYTAGISPRDDIFVVKSADGRLAVYSFEPPALIKKFRFSKVNGSQDDNFCFSPDGAEFYNVERHGDSCHSALAIYDTSDFSLKKRILCDNDSMCVTAVEFDKDTDAVFVSYFIRNAKGEASRFCVGKLNGNEVKDTVSIAMDEYELYRRYIRLRMMGFTKKAYDWSYVDVGLEDLKNADMSLSELWHKRQ